MSRVLCVHPHSRYNKWYSDVIHYRAEKEIPWLAFRSMKIDFVYVRLSFIRRLLGKFLLLHSLTALYRATILIKDKWTDTVTNSVRRSNKNGETHSPNLTVWPNCCHCWLQKLMQQQSIQWWRAVTLLLVVLSSNIFFLSLSLILFGVETSPANYCYNISI